MRAAAEAICGWRCTSRHRCCEETSQGKPGATAARGLATRPTVAKQVYSLYGCQTVPSGVKVPRTAGGRQYSVPARRPAQRIWDAGYEACLLDPPPDREFARESGLNMYELGYQAAETAAEIRLDDVLMESWEEGCEKGTESMKTSLAADADSNMARRLKRAEDRLKVAEEREKRAKEELKLAREREFDAADAADDARDQALFDGLDKSLAILRKPLAIL